LSHNKSKEPPHGSAQSGGERSESSQIKQLIFIIIVSLKVAYKALLVYLGRISLP